jgi:hypothetical protein
VNKNIYASAEGRRRDDTRSLSAWSAAFTTSRRRAVPGNLSRAEGSIWPKTAAIAADTSAVLAADTLLFSRCYCRSFFSVRTEKEEGISKT